ncbi:MAG: hypothetical protein JWQ33_1358 [Ramlibacter sp.]|nr:hypothetical protein [Ramlibacter sp.]
MADGFLGRWSKRKLDARGRPPEPAPLLPDPAVPEAVIAANAGIQTSPAPTAAPVVAEPPPLTLEDAQALTPESDFRPFAARGVAPEVQNAAMKKLFSDPHFNVMDRLDTYIDDYSQPDPMPMEMLRKLASAKFLGLFDEEEKQEAEQAAEQARRARELADNPTSQTVAQSAAAPAVPSAHAHDDPDLRLQQDDAPAGKEPGGGAA